MCGCFGFVAKKGREASMPMLRKIARVTERRGRHAFGFSWIDRNGRLRMFKQSGKISDSLGLLSIARDARMLIGHCRYATQGDPANNLNNHPHPVDGGWFVHNGMLPDYQDLIRRQDLYPNTDCDSEVLGLLMEDADGSLADRMREAINATRYSPLVMLGLWGRPRRLLAARRGNPLSIGEHETGHYFASLPDGLPGDVEEVEDGTVLEFTRETIERYPLWPDGKAPTPFALKGLAV
jgi:glucosamine--fructose-6-phosphate aminotransferase (isomerizing)